MLVYTLWSEWAECNVCGRGNGERRRTGITEYSSYYKATKARLSLDLGQKPAKR